METKLKGLVTLFWTFAFLQMIVYVVGSMNGIAFDLMIGTAISIPCAICICIVAHLIPESNEETEVSPNH